ncbi:MAG: MlaE family ABC transporter permease [Gammaproteobacteria bacterium]
MLAATALRIGRLGRLGLFLGRTCAGALRTPPRARDLLDQMAFVGAHSVPVIAVSAAFVGMVLALQFHQTLVRFGSVALTGAAVGLGLVRELGPVLTAIMVTARAGSALCAEIAIMRTEQQIDALECMSIDPLRQVVAPRLAAVVLAVPLLTAIFIVVGIFGGWVVARGLFDVTPAAYFAGMFDALGPGDLALAAAKSVVFGVLVGWIATARGFHLHQSDEALLGAAGISRATTAAVVWTCIAILGADCLLGMLFG